jgi:hypothetical protein
MAVDHIRYDILAQDALRSVVRTVLIDAAAKGLPGEHHFYISFDTHAEGVRISPRMLSQYPEEMTVVLQHQFWDLVVTDTGFEVGVSFGGIPERLAVPFAAITGFFDPSVQFGLQFEEVNDGQQNQSAPANAQDKGPRELLKEAPKEAPKDSPKAVPSTRTSRVPAMPERAPPAAMPAPDPTPDKPDGGGQVVRLDRFRKK